MKYLLMSLWLEVVWYYTYGTCKVVYVHVGVVRWGEVFKYVGVVSSGCGLIPYPPRMCGGGKTSCGGPGERQGPREGDKQ